MAFVILLLAASVGFAASTPERAAAARKCAAESIVLLKNDGTLPLAAGASVRYANAGNRNYIGCGQGSAVVFAEKVVDVREGLMNAGLKVDDSANIAVVTIVRDASEGFEVEDFGTYQLSAEEREHIAALKKSGVGKLVIVLNVGTHVSVRELKDDPAVAAILYVSFPGMEGGNAVADVLKGAVNPSGRLNVTLANKLEDYPSTATWQEARLYVPYEEDIFVGYRYFSTIPKALAGVTYPFGHGLSYTEFRHVDAKVEQRGDKVFSRVTVENVGKVAGRESVLVYSGIVGGKTQHAARELRAFGKTRLLQPGECETLELQFSVVDLAYFDDEGASGKAGSWVIDGGTYSIYLGGAVDSAAKAGEFELSEKVLSTPGFKFTSSTLANRLRADGSFSRQPVTYGAKTGIAGFRKNVYPRRRPETPIMLQDVAHGKNTIDEFIDQMPPEDIVRLLQGQPNILDVGNTRSIGVMKEYGMPGLQTADGPVGIRLGQRPKKGEKAKSEQWSTIFPATALTTCSFDIDLQETFGRVLGEEAAAVGIDIHLAPGVCISRNPLCGRNFEYMGEDPYLAGRMAAAFIRGVQSQGVASTIKHFAGNNRENLRRESTDIVSERAMREIYLRAFDIAIHEAKPKCLMSSYNMINGTYAGGHYGLLTGILRDEWGYEGLVMTDWHDRSHLWQDISAGNNVKMPAANALGFNAILGGGSSADSGSSQANDYASYAFCRNLWNNDIPRETVRAAVRKVVELVMESKRFKETLK